MTNVSFVLASASPRRVALLRDIGIKPDKILAAHIDETPQHDELPRQLAERLALSKVKLVADNENDSFVLAADTVVACGRRILPKAETADEVCQCLKLLSGRRHRVMTGVALHVPNGKTIQRLAESTVTFNLMSPAAIDAYVDSGEGIGKAGGYAIQGRAATHIRFISGSYSNIVGLPLFDVAQMLHGAGFIW